MELLEAIKSRKSIRAFTADQVPRKVLKEILDTARWAPSSGNTQPWEFIVVAQEALIKMGNAVGNSFRNKDSKPNPDVNMFGKNPTGLHAKRRQQLFKAVTECIEAEDDKSKMLEWFKLAERQYHAPAYILVVADKSASGWFVLDVGLVTQSITLIAQEYGLGTCIMSGTSNYPEAVRNELNISESKQIVVGIAIGYPDWEHPLNGIRREREEIDNLITWYE